MEPTPTVTSNGHGASAIPGLNLEDFRLPQNFTELVGVRRMLTRVPVRRPDRQWFVRTHPEPTFHFTTAIIEVKEDREHYLCLLYTSPSPRDRQKSRMPSSA